MNQYEVRYRFKDMDLSYYNVHKVNTSTPENAVWDLFDTLTRAERRDLAGVTVIKYVTCIVDWREGLRSYRAEFDPSEGT